MTVPGPSSPHRRLLIILATLLLLAGAALAVDLIRRAPANDRDWVADHARPAGVSVRGRQVHIEDLRDFRHAADGSFEPAYRTAVYDADDVRSVWLVLAPFARRWRGLAHTFVSFELTGERFVAVSVEARRERGEDYSLLGGLLRRFEVTYVVGTEEDLVGLRALRGDTLYLYPTAATPEQGSELLLDMMGRAGALEASPEFYNTLSNNCTTNLRDHVNALFQGALPWGWGVLLPGYSDGLALEAGLLDTDLPLEDARVRFRVDEKARAALDRGADLSLAMRRGLRAADR